MEDEKNAKPATRYRNAFSWLPKLKLGGSKEVVGTESESSVQQSETSVETVRKKKPWWVHAIRWTIATIIVLAIKVYFLGGWPMSGEYKFKVKNEAAAAVEGTVCDLFRELEEERSTLLQKPGEQVIFQKDTVSESGVESSLVITSRSPVPEEASLEEEAIEHRAALEDINLDDLIHFEAMANGQARLIFKDGNCELYDLGAVLRLLDEQDECHLFQAIPYEGKKYEFFNIMYTEAFEKIVCEEGTFYRARLDITKARCPSVHSLLSCGTDFFSGHIYRKLRQRLEYMNEGISYKFKKTYELYPCKCSGEEAPLPAASPRGGEESDSIEISWGEIRIDTIGE